MKQRGFTLMEIMVVIGIIALLVGILVPAVMIAKNAARTSETQSSINMISGGAAMFANDFNGQYPPSEAPASANDPDPFALRTNSNMNSGAKIICALLTGYAEDIGTAGAPSATNNRWTADDGKDDTGFRMNARGKVYGPYNGCEKITMSPPLTDHSATAKVFLDSWEHPILYYRANDTGTRFATGDNTQEDPDLSQAFLNDNFDVNIPCLVTSPGPNDTYSDPDNSSKMSDDVISNKEK